MSTMKPTKKLVTVGAVAGLMFATAAPASALGTVTRSCNNGQVVGASTSSGAVTYAQGASTCQRVEASARYAAMGGQAYTSWRVGTQGSVTALANNTNQGGHRASGASFTS